MVDLDKKVVLSPGEQEFIEARGDTLLFHRANSHTGTGYRTLNLATGEAKFINYDEQDRQRNERASPDKKHYLSITNPKYHIA